MFCGNCGTQLRDGDRFCPNCGAKVRIGQQEKNRSSPKPGEEHVSQPQAQGAKSEVEQPKTPTPEAPPTKESPVEESRSSSLGNGAVRLASVVDAMKDAFNGESLHCGICGARLKAGVQFCPGCGTPTGLPGKKIQQNRTSEPLSAKWGQWKEMTSQWIEQQKQAGQSQEASHEQAESGTPEATYTDETQKAAPENKTENPKKKGAVKKEVLVSVAVVLIVAFFSRLELGGHKSVRNETEDPFEAGGLSFVGEPSWEVNEHRNGDIFIEIRGKVEADAWIGTTVWVTATFYDSDGAILGTNTDHISDMRAGDVWSYEIAAYYNDLSSFEINGVTY